MAIVRATNPPVNGSRTTPPATQPAGMSSDEFQRMWAMYNTSQNMPTPPPVNSQIPGGVGDWYGPEYAQTMGGTKNLSQSGVPFWEQLKTNQYANNPSTPADVSPTASFQVGGGTTPGNQAPVRSQFAPQTYQQTQQDASSMLGVNMPGKQIAGMDTTGMSANEKKILGPYQQLEGMLDENNSKYANIMSFVDKETKNMLIKNRENYMKLHDEQKAKGQEYYGDLGASTSKKMAEEQALAQSLAGKSGARPGDISNTMSDLASRQLEDMLKVKSAELQYGEQLYNSYKQIEDEFVKNYAGSTDRNIVQTYKEILNTKNQLANSVTEARRQVQNAEMQQKMAMAQQAAAAASQQKLAEYQAQQQAGANQKARQEWQTKVQGQFNGLVNPNMGLAMRQNPLTMQYEVFSPTNPNFQTMPMTGGMQNLGTGRANFNTGNNMFTGLTADDYLFGSGNNLFTGSYGSGGWNIPSMGINGSGGTM